MTASVRLIKALGADWKTIHRLSENAVLAGSATAEKTQGSR